MPKWTPSKLGTCIESLDAGVSVNSEDRPHRAGEIGVLKTSALSGYLYRPNENKAVVRSEVKLVAEPVLSDSILISRMNTPELVGESCYVSVGSDTLYLPDRIWQVKLRKPPIAKMRWLSYLLQSAKFRSYLLVHATGTSGSMKNLTKPDLLNFPVCYPSDSEQSVMAEVFVSLDHDIGHTRALIEKLKYLKQGLLTDLLTRGIDSNGDLRPDPSRNPDSYKVSAIGLIPREWNIRALKSLGSIQSGATPSRERVTRYFNTDGTPWVKTLDLNEDLIVDTQERITTTALRETSCSMMPVGAVLIAMYGGWEQIGRASLLATCAATNQAISSLVLEDRNIRPEYVLRALQQGRSRWKRIAASTRKDPNITKADVENFLIAVPARPEEQTAIVSRFRGVLNRLVAEQGELAKLQAIKRGLMDDLLTGRVRVTSLLMK